MQSMDLAFTKMPTYVFFGDVDQTNSVYVWCVNDTNELKISVTAYSHGPRGCGQGQMCRFLSLI